jgi:glutamate-1-semialdehyde 2,1-aminomutase
VAISIDAYSKHDQQIWDEELNDFVPDRLFDAHIHLFHPDHTSQSGSSSTWGMADLEILRKWSQRLYPGRQAHFLALGTPIVGIDVARHNAWCVEQIQQDPHSRFNCLVTPSCDVKDIESLVQRQGVIGLKPYRLFSVTGDVDQCRIHEFLPHSQLELANERGLFVTMHLSRFHGCADQLNLADLRAYACHRYPRIRWILAHCARSFTYWPIRKAIDQLRDIPNIWYDVSAVTDVRPLITLFTREDRRRILYGSDGVDATYFHGQYAAMGRAWQYINEGRVELKFPHCDSRPILAIYEQLLAMKHAAEIAQWSTSDIEDVFWRNATQQFSVCLEDEPNKQNAIAPSIDPQQVYRRARQLIPGGTQLLSKRPEMYAPGRWPTYFKQAHGCEVIDLTNRRFTDMTTSGIGSCLLGYADPDVTAAVQRRIGNGSMSTLNVPEEVELAELLIELHPWAQQVRYARTGGESMSIAVRIARAATGRDKVAFCGYHGWSDWYLAANLSTRGASDELRAHLLPGLEPSGVPRGLANTALPFTYNDLDGLKKLVTDHGSQLAAIVMEPTRSQHPDPGFLEGVRKIANQFGAVLIFDEISSGWRMHVGGVHLKYGVDPDIAVFAKAISNGHPMAAIIGRRATMESAQTTFISSTYWTEGVGPTAALATINKIRRINIAAHTSNIGGQMREGWHDLGKRIGVPVKVAGHAALLHLGFDHPQAAELGTLVTALMLDHGFLTGGGFYPSLAHTDQHVAKYLDALATVFIEVAQAIEGNDVAARLIQLGCLVRHSGFARLT